MVGLTRIAVVALTTFSLGWSASSLADDNAGDGPASAVASDAAVSDTAVAPPASNAVNPRTGHRQSSKRLTVAQSIEEMVRRMTRILDLDSEQQTKLRQILVDQHRHVMEIRTGQAGAQPDIVGTTLAIYDQTKARIRAMLSDEQKKKYSVDVPRDELAPAQADLQHWLDLQESKRRQGPGEDVSK